MLVSKKELIRVDKESFFVNYVLVIYSTFIPKSNAKIGIFAIKFQE